MFKSIGSSIKKLFGTKYERDVAGYTPLVDEANIQFERLRELSNDELRSKTLEFRERIAEFLSEIDADTDSIKAQAEAEEDILEKEALFNELDKLREERDKQLEVVLMEILPAAFAVVKETARRFTENKTLTVTATEHDRNLAARPGKSYVKIEGDKAIWHNSWVAAGGEITWNMVHYDVQLIGGMALHEGKIAEMATGEGKTLVATLPAYLNGLSGQGVHIITVNDYLARRDSEWVGPIFEFLFLTVDCIDKYRPHSTERRNAYLCDITYGTNNEFGFDYLRDNMVRSMEEMVQRKHHYAMVDEVDSVLVDDARTPLIISGPVSQGADDQDYIELKPQVERLMAAQQKLVTGFLSEGKKLFEQGKTGYQEGEAGMALLRAYRGLPKYRPLIKFMSEEGVKVHVQKAENHYMQEQSKNMHIADAPLYFVIDEKNRNVELTELGVEQLSKGNEDPSFYVMPDVATRMVEIDNDAKLSKAEKEEAKNRLSQDFAVKSKRLHAISQLLKAYTLFERDDEYVVIDGQVKIVDEQTGRMMEGRRYSDGLHQALEAKENVKVGEITQTYATVTLQNYFRMYHKLAGMTGTAETEASEFWDIYKLDVVVIPTNRPIIRRDEEDLVFKTEREKFNAVIDEIVNLSNAGRPVLVGTTSVDISEKLSRMLKLKGLEHNVLNAKQHQREAEIVAEAGRPGKVTIATNMAGRGTDIKITDEVKAAGGLAIIGTERHESRRIDRQLRGRAGRQGDPGTSQFYVSLEDKLMRLFQSERIASIMDRMGHKDGEVIQHSMVTRSIERAQKKVEENNFGIRKRLLEYDDVMNIQREAIYKKRKNAVSGERLAVDLNNMFEAMIENLVFNHKKEGSFESFRRDALGVIGFDPQMDAADFKEGRTEEVADTILEQFNEFYHRKFQSISDLVMPQINHVYETQRERYKRILIPFTDGSSHPLPISAEIEKAVKTKGKSITRDIEKAVTLAIIDDKWKEHLRSMDELKDSVQGASFEQKDPLVIYKMEAYNLFEQLVMDINESVTAYLAKGSLFIPEGQEVQQAREVPTDLSRTRTNRSEDAARRAAESVSQRSAKPETFRRTEEKIGRNDLCPCGSGKKYKHCHGR
ncbi:MAG: preprotein translocase subunit SecA [Lewinellaceae bacterium]|nr:preprotein translocase subunit SecA [Lewinella sp.]MCB9277286.1 preprotein translocase subunit SecA [Lewinellaceae bacterium]